MLTPGDRRRYAQRTMKTGELLNDRYRVERRLGGGAQGETLLATDVESGGQVVLKLFDLSAGGDWSDFDRFEAEARVLRGIDHPRIPDYLDQFEETADGLLFVLVQEFVDGPTLAELVVSGKRRSIDEIKRIAGDLLEIVAYLQSISPVVIHRDINPKNVILGRDGSVYLVDFGGVQDIVRRSGTTVIGTPGYVPLEQFSGRATPRSDLYGFAATILTLLTHRNPAELPVSRLKVDLDSSCPGLDPAVREVLESYLEPDAADRDLPVSRAVSLLRGEVSAESIRPRPPEDTPVEANAGETTALPSIPAGSKLTYRVDPDGTEVVTIPAAGVRGKGLVLLPFALFWNGFVALWTFGAVSMGAPVFFALFSLPFWAVGIGFIVKLLKDFLERIEIRVTADGGSGGMFRLTRRVGPVVRTVELPTHEIGAPVVENGSYRNGSYRNHSYRGGGYRSGGAVTGCVFEAGVRKIRIGAHLSEREQRWLSRFIERHATDTL